MPLPDRPVSGASIASEWGQAIHDYTFAPKGCEASGGAVTCVQNVDTALPLDTAVSDPGGFVNTTLDRIVIPTGGEGLYLVILTIEETGGVTGDSIRAMIYINGAYVTSISTPMDTGSSNGISVPYFAQLSAGDIITPRAVKRGSTGASPSVNVVSLQVVRLGAEYGA